MKIYTSYFYQVRHFSKNMVPLSTAVWDPKWFHLHDTQDVTFIDAKGVYNGLRATPFVPDDTCPHDCSKECKQKPKGCTFLTAYRKQLDRLNFQEILQRFERLGNDIKRYEKFVDEPIMVLLFHEAYDNPCSERWVVLDWFRDNGYPITELPVGKVARL